MTDPSAKPRSSRTLLIVIIIVLLVIICGGSVPIIGIFAAIAIPNFVMYQHRAKRAEVPMNVDGIRVTQIAYQAMFDQYLAAPEPVPLDPVMIGPQLVSWPSGTDFEELGWMPDGQVRGTYWVTVSADGTDFEVHGLCDVDGDGEPAHYIATRHEPATMQTGTNVF